MQASEKKYLINRIRRRIQWENAAKGSLDLMRAQSWSVEEILRTVKILEQREGIPIPIQRIELELKELRIQVLQALRKVIRALPEPDPGRDPEHDPDEEPDGSTG